MIEQNNKLITPLGLIGIFITFTETTLGIGMTQTSGNIQIALTVFVIAFPMAIAGFFFFMLWRRPLHLYAPFEYGSAHDALVFIDAIKSSVDTVKNKADDVAKIAQHLEELKLDVDEKVKELKLHAVATALSYSC